MSGLHYIKIFNGLLEPKHCEAMGESVWLYMLLQDKCTSVNDNGEGKVLGNKPIIFEEDIFPILGCSRRTYSRWITKLRDAGYIKTLRTPAGLVIVITKAKKYSKQQMDAPKKTQEKSDAPKKTRDVPQSTRDVPYPHIQYKTIQRLYKDYLVSTNVDTLGELSAAEYKELISKLYYFVINKLDLPVRNHTTLRSAIGKMAKHQDREKIINYFDFLANQYEELDWEMKPHLSESLDIHDKRGKIRETFKRHVQGGNRTKGIKL